MGLIFSLRIDMGKTKTLGGYIIIMTSDFEIPIRISRLPVFVISEHSIENCPLLENHGGYPVLLSTRPRHCPL